MTNKERIEALKRQLIFHPSYLNIIEDIEKDLEILEFLRKLLKGANILKKNEIDISKYVAKLSESTNEQLKEWLGEN